MSGARRRHQGKRTERRRRSAAAAAGALLLIPAVAAGEPVTWADEPAVALAGNAGNGLVGLTDPDSVSADGSAPQSTQIGLEVLAEAGNPDLLGGPGVTMPNGPLGIPGTMLQAYMRAAQTMAATTPGCHVQWPLLASIGRIESNHARGGKVDAKGTTASPILGPVLNGGGFAAIADTDGGRYDGDARWDRAVGPMQFIPSTWRGYASDGNADGETNPNNVFDATLGAAKYLCSGGLDLANPQHRATAVFRYNHSDSYVRTVLVWADAYAKGVSPLPTTPVDQIDQVALPPQQSPNLPAPDPGIPGVDPTQSPSVPPSTTTPPGDSSSTSPTTPPVTTTTTTPPTTTTPACPTTSTPPTTTTTTPPVTTTTTGTPDPCAPTTTPTTTPSGPASESSPASTSVVTSTPS